MGMFPEEADKEQKGRSEDKGAREVHKGPPKKGLRVSSERAKSGDSAGIGTETSKSAPDRDGVKNHRSER
jgi:hypothetical protein